MECNLQYSYPLARIAQTCGVYLTLFVSVHRFLGVCHPFRAKRWVTGYSYPLARIAQTCGVYLTLFVSVHRFLGVCHPFRAKRWVTG
uniref:G_PROTEIN_RECEP_F1_2 domain-containing protein n=2 Tax=Ascaris lumbricoides TaxID=6252 RepID=A0A0M3IX90_ASCLU